VLGRVEAAVVVVGLLAVAFAWPPQAESAMLSTAAAAATIALRRALAFGFTSTEA